ncbi:MAG: YebC/PmpR family DNA-binding transcriptional regulator [Planctomycetota bacterium]
MAGHSAWKNIKHRKAAVDKKRGKIWCKVSRQLIVAAQKGGGDPAFNPSLRFAVDAARAANMPRDTIEKAIRKGTGEGSEERYEPARYEGYGPGGVAILVEALISNANKAAADIRVIFDKNGGKIGVPGSVAFGFASKGQVIVEGSPGDRLEERLMDCALDAGAEDIQGDADGTVFRVLCPPNDLMAVRNAIERAGIAVDSAEFVWIPATTVELDESTAAELQTLVDALEDHDDVQKVHTNQA